jgi:hypothetical protein
MWKYKMWFVKGQINGVYIMGEVKLLSTFGKIKTIVDVLYVWAS